MSRPNFFLRTKASAAACRHRTTAASAFNEPSASEFQFPITMVAADAGCGKTTLICGFYSPTITRSRFGINSTTPMPIRLFFSVTSYTALRILPRISAKPILPYCRKATDELLRFPERAVDLLLNEILETIEQPFFLVLDDYHHIGRETIVHKFVDRLFAVFFGDDSFDYHDARFAAAGDYAPPFAIRRLDHYAR